MSELSIYQSKATGRFYLGMLNLGGHGAFGEIRPVGLREVLDIKDVEELYRNHGAKMHSEVDDEEKYEGIKPDER